MKPEEAIEELRLFVDHKAYTDEFQDMCRTAIASLEKQIPKKPEKKKELVFCDLDNGRHESGKKDVFCCPICGESVGRKYGEPVESANILGGLIAVGFSSQDG